jgi:hypothetical protein
MDNNDWDELSKKYLSGEMTFDEMWEENDKRAMKQMNFTPKQFYREDFYDLDNALKEFARSCLDFQRSFSTADR